MKAKNPKQILRAYWKDKDGYEGSISCRCVARHENYAVYAVETDGNNFDAIVYDSDPDNVFVQENGLVGRWECTNNAPVVEINGLPVIAF